MRRIALAAAAAFVASCSSEVAKSNPFDPEAPVVSQERARIEGRVALEGALGAAGVTVTVSEATSGTSPVQETTQTAANGSYAVAVPPGAYNVEIKSQGYLPELVNNVALRPGETRTLGLVTLAVARGAIQGQVILDDGLSPSGTTISIIPLDNPNARVVNVIAGPDGGWFATGLRSGDYVLRAEKESYAPAYTGRGQSLSAEGEGLFIDAGGVLTAPTLRLYPASAIVQAKVRGVINAPYSNSRDLEVQLLAFVQFLTDMRVSEDETFADPDKGDTDYREFSAQVAFRLGDLDGRHEIHAQFRDIYDLESDVFSTFIVLDREPPVIQSLVLNGGAAFLTSLDGIGLVSAEAVGADDMSGIGGYRAALSRDSITDVPVISASLLAPGGFRLNTQSALGDANGVKTLFLEVLDRAGNHSALKEASIFRDRLPPQLGTPSVALDPGSVDAESEALALDVLLHFDVTGDRAGERLSMALANAPGLDAGSFFLPFETPWRHRLAEGPDALARQLCVLFRDEAGLLTEQQCIPVRVDRSGVVLGQARLEGEADHSGIQIDLTNAGDASTVWRDFTDASGGWRIEGVPGGLGYTLRLSRAGFLPQVVQDVVVLTGRAVDRGTTTLLLPRATVAGMVTLVGKGAGQHAGIVISDADGLVTAVTGPNGGFTLPGLVTGRAWSFSASALGYTPHHFAQVQNLAAGEVRALPAATLQKQEGDFRVCAGDDDRFCSRGAIAFTSSRTVLLDVKSTLTQWRVSLDPTFDGGSQAFAAFDASTEHRFTFAAAEPDGAKTLYAQLRAGAQEPPEPNMTGVVTLDTTPPVVESVSITSRGGTAPVAYMNHPQGSVDVIFEAADALAGLGDLWGDRFDEDLGHLGPVSLPQVSIGRVRWSLEPATQGVQWIVLTVCDAVGNCADGASDSVVYDTVAPENATLAINHGAQFTNTPVVTVTVQTGDAVGLKLGNTESLLGAETLSVTDGASIDFQHIVPLGDGTKRVYAQLVDAAGNATATSPNGQHAQIILDTLPPANPQIRVPRRNTNEDTMEVSYVAFSFDRIAVDTVSDATPPADDWTDAGASEPDWTVTRTVSLPTDGVWTLSARFMDQAGNMSARVTEQVIKDTVPPQLAQVRIREAPFTRVQRVNLDLFASGASQMILAGDGVIDGEQPQLYAPSAAVDLLPAGAGPRTVRVRYLDLAMNAAEASDTTTVDTDGASDVTFSIREAPFTRNAAITLQIGAAGATQMRIANNSSFAGAAWEPFAVSRAWTAAPGDGPKTVFLALRDDAGNETGALQAQTTLDTTPPGALSVRIAGGLDAVSTPVVSLDLSAADANGLSDMIVANDASFGAGSWEPYATVRTSWPLEPGDGPKTVFVRFRDMAGNVADKADTITLDTAAPTGTVTLAGGLPAVQSAIGVAVTLTASADVRRMKLVEGLADCNTELVDINYNSSQVVSFADDPLDGIRVLTACFQDAAGLVGSATDTVLQDRGAPGATLLVNGGNGLYTRDSVVTLNLEASDLVSGVDAMRLSNDPNLTGAVWEPLVPQRSWTVATPTLDGTKNIYLQVRDRAGNPTTVGGTAIRDSAACQGTVTAGAGAYADSSTVTVTVTRGGETTCAQMALSQTFLDCSGAAYLAFNAAPPPLILAGGDGLKTIYFCLKDLAGNTSGFSTSVTVDTTNPAGTLAIDNGAAFTINTARSVTLNMTASGDVVDMKVANGAAINCTTAGYLGFFNPAYPHTLATGEGSTTVKVCLKDAAGRTTTLTDTIFLDTVKPALGSPAISIPPAELTPGGAAMSLDVTLAFAVSNDRAGEKLFMAVASASGLDANAFFVPLQTPYLHRLPEGPDAMARQVCAIFKDEAGNVSAETCRAVTVDRTGVITGRALLEPATTGPYNGTQVELSDGATTFLTTTDAAGNYTLTVPGRLGYTLRLSHIGYVAQTARDVAVFTGQIADRGTVTLALPRGSLSGTVSFVDKGAGLHSGIVISDTGSTLTGVTSPNGTFLLDRLITTRTYNLTARYPGYVTYNFTAVGDLAEGEVRDLGSVTLQKQQGDFRICAGSGDAFCSLGAIDYTKSRTVLLDVQSSLTLWRVSQSDTFSDDAVPFAPFVASERHDFTFAPGEVDGQKTIYVQFKNGGTPEPKISGVVTLDTTAPVAPALNAVIIDPGANGVGAIYNNHPAGLTTLHLDANDALAGVAAVRIANAEPLAVPVFTSIAKRAFNASMAHNLDIGAQGARFVYVQFCDAVDNCTTVPASPGDSILYDTIPPGTLTGVSIRVNADAPVTNSPFVTANVSTGDAVALRFGNTQSLLGSDFLSVTPGQSIAFSHILPLGDGPKTVYAQYRDAAGNLSATEPNPHQDTITLDTVPPTGGSLTLAGNGYTNLAAASATLTAADASHYMLHVGISEDFSGESWVVFTGTAPLWTMSGVSAPIPGPADGTWTVFARFKDVAGNVSITFSRGIIRDTVAPQLPSVSIVEGDFATGSRVNLELFAVGASHMILAPDGTISDELAQNYAQVAAVDLLPTGPGLRSVQVRFLDLAGNPSDTVSDSTLVDSTPPSAVTFSILEGASTRSANVVLQIGATGATQMMLANLSTLAGASWEPYATSRSWALAPFDGTKTVYLKLRDEAGNETSTFSATTLLDGTAPGSLLVAVAGGAGYTFSATVSVDLSAADANGMSDIMLANDALFSNGVWEPYLTTRPGWTLPSGDGLKTVYVRFRDNAGNVAEKADPITLDTSPPAGTVSLAGGAVAITNPVGVVVSIAASADVRFMKLFQGFVSCLPQAIDVTYNPFAIFTFTGSPPDGTQVLTVCLKDAAGLIGGASDTVILDRVAPSAGLTINGGTGLYTRSPVVTLALSASDLTSGVDAIRVANQADMTGVAWESFVGSKTWTVAAPSNDGTKTVFLEARDAANLVGTASATVILDTQAPSGSITVSGGTHSQTDVVFVTVTRGDVNTTEMAISQAFLDCSGATYGAFNATPPALTLGGGDGLKTLYLCLRDLAGNTVGYSTTVTVDTVTPSGSLRINAGAAYSTGVAVTLNMATDPDVVEMKIANGASITCTGTAGYVTFNSAPSHNLATGDSASNEVRVCVRDASGRTATLADGIGLDTAVPVAQAVGGKTGISINNNGGETNSTLVTLALAASDVTSGVTDMKISDGTGCAGGAWQAYNTVALWTLEPGDNVSRSVSVQFRDAAGLVTPTCAVDEITVDTVNATVTVFVLDGGGVSADYADGATISITNLTYVGNCASIQVSEDASFTSTLPGAITAYPCNQTWGQSTKYRLYDIAQDGLKYVYARVVDSAGNASPAAVDTVILDTGGPVEGAVVIDGGAAYSADLALTVAFVAAGAQEMKVSTNQTCTGGTWEALKSADSVIHPGPDGFGLLWVSAEFRDTAGNGEGVCYASSVIYDAGWNGAGSVVIVPVEGLAGFTTSTQVNLALTRGESGAGVEMKISNGAGCIGGAWEPFAASKSWTLSSGGEGTRTVSVVYKDPAGNLSGCYADDVDVDTVPPSGLSILLAGGADYTNDAGSQVTLAISGTGIFRVKVSEDPTFAGASFVTIGAASPFQLSGANGSKTVFLLARDQAGNEATSVVADSIALDNVAPTGNLIVDGNALATTDNAGFVTLGLNATDNPGSGVATMELRVADAQTNFGNWQSPLPYAPTVSSFALAAPRLTVDNSLRFVEARFRDRAGNVSIASRDMIYLDNVDPGGAPPEINGNSTYTASQVVAIIVYGYANTPLDMKVSNGQGCNGGDWKPHSSLVEDWLLDGTGDDVIKYVSIRFRDEAGNLSPCYEDSIQIDTAAPVAQFVSIESGADASSANTLGLTVSYSGAASARYIATTEAGLTVATAQNPLTAATFNATGQPEGLLTLYVQFADAAGNRSNKVLDSIVRDLSSPTGGSVLADGGATYSTAANGQVTLTMSAVDTWSPVTQMEIKNAGGAFQTFPFAQSYLGWPAGTAADDAVTRSVIVRFKDRVGNVSSETTDAIIVDNVAPALTSMGIVNLGGGTARTNSSEVFLATSASGSAAGGPQTMRVDNSSSCAAGVTLPFRAVFRWDLEAEGDQGTIATVAVAVLDAAGNTSACVTDTIDVDTIAPLLTSVTLDGSYSSTGALQGSDPAVTQDCFVQAAAASVTGTYQALQFGLNHTFEGATEIAASSIPTFGMQIPAAICTDGLKTIYVRARDLAGNLSEYVAIPMRVDLTEPTFGPAGVRINGNASTTESPDLSITVDAVDAGMAKVRLGTSVANLCTTGGTSYAWAAGATYSFSLPVTSTDGTKTIFACLIDTAGRASPTILSDSIVLDRTAPAGCAITLVGRKVDGSASPAEKTATPHVTVNIAGCAEVPAEMYLATSSVTCNSGLNVNWLPFSASSIFTLDGLDGINTVKGCVRDAVRNLGTLTADTIELDTAPPSAARAVIDNDAVYVNAALKAARGNVNQVSVQGFAVGAVEWSLSETAAFGAFTSYTTNNPQNFTFSVNDGTKTIHALFKDDVGNLSAVSSDSIIFDTTPPSLGAREGVTVVSPTGNDFTNSVSTVLQVEAPTDAPQVVLAPAASFGACADADTSGRTPQPVSSVVSFLLPPGDGIKRVCAKFWDAAGNVSAFVSDIVTLDTLAPSAPLITTKNKVVNLADNATFAVNTFGAVTESNFERYDRLGGKDAIWTADSTAIATTAFTFRVVSSDADEDGVPNLLRLRAVDKAGNFSPEASVIITTDINLPEAVTLNAFWVSNGNGHGTVWWKASTSADVAGYKIYYGSGPGVYNGLGAVQGNSPFTLGIVTAANLSGLQNGAQTYVTVRPVDLAGNEGPAPSSPAEVMLQPNRVSPSLISSIQLPMDKVSRLAVYGEYAYALGYDNPSGCLTAGTVLSVIHLARLVSPVQGGVIHDNPDGASVVQTLTFADGFADCDSVNNGLDLVIDGNHLFFASGTRLRTYRLADPVNPTLLSTINFTPVIVHSIAVRGPTLFVAGRPRTIIALNIGDLYDNSSGTLLGITDEIDRDGTLASPYPGGLTWSRDTLVQTSYNGALVAAYRIADALDGNAATAWDNLDQQSYVGGMDIYSGNQFASGSYLYLASRSGFGVYNMKPVWTGGVLDETRLLQMAGTGGQGYSILGGQAFLMNGDDDSIHSLDLSTIADITESGITSKDTISPVSTATYGNYLLVGKSLGYLEVYEIATPRSLHEVISTGVGGDRHQIVGRYLYSSNGPVLDLQGGTPPTTVTSSNSCDTYDAAMLDEDVMVQAKGTYLTVVDYTKVIDDNIGTTFDINSDSSDVVLTVGVTAKAIEAVGNFLVVAESRADGTYLEVFKAADLRDRRVFTALTTAGDSIGAFKASPVIGADLELTMHMGRALLTLDGTSDGLVIVDLRDWLDDTTTTTVDAADWQGFIPTSQPPNQVDAQGGYAYVAIASNGGGLGANTGLEIIDVKEAFDEVATSKVPTTASKYTAAVGYSYSVKVFGSYALVAPLGLSGRITAVDVSDPTAPVVASTMPHFDIIGTCGGVDKQQGISVLGSRAYVSGSDSVRIVELE